jgi:hypothetical protein
MVLDTAIAALLQGKEGHEIHAFIAGADRYVERRLPPPALFHLLRADTEGSKGGV